MEKRYRTPRPDNNKNNNITQGGPLDIGNYQEYYLIKENIIYKITIEKFDDNIFIKCKNYSISINKDEFNSLFKRQFNSIDTIFEYIYNIFEENKIIIDKIISYQKMNLLFNNNNNIELKYNNYDAKKNKDNSFIINHIEIMNKMKNMEEEINKLKSEIVQLKRYHEINNKPKNIKFKKNIINDSYTHLTLDNSFITFKSIDDILYLIYANKNKSMICYDLIKQTKIKELKTIHEKYISYFRHCLDVINKKDLVMSSDDNIIKVWNVKNWNCFLNIENTYQSSIFFTACFLNKNNKIYIITSNYNQDNCNNNNFKIYDLQKNKIKEIQNSERTIFIDTYYDKLLSKYYIITGNRGCSQSFDYDKNTEYYQYIDSVKNYNINSIIIKNNIESIKLIESCSDGFIRIFNFHSGLLLKKIKIIDKVLYGLCLWNENYLIVGCGNKTINIIELESEINIKCLNSHNNDVLTIKKINHPKLGECLLSQNLGESEIKLWINES